MFKASYNLKKFQTISHFLLWSTWEIFSGWKRCFIHIEYSNDDLNLKLWLGWIILPYVSTPKAIQDGSSSVKPVLALTWIHKSPQEVTIPQKQVMSMSTWINHFRIKWITLINKISAYMSWWQLKAVEKYLHNHPKLQLKNSKLFCYNSSNTKTVRPTLSVKDYFLRPLKTKIKRCLYNKHGYFMDCHCHNPCFISLHCSLYSHGPLR